METIVINSSNLVNKGSGNNTFKYRFPSSVQFSNNEVAVSQVSMYYSWYNISLNLGNNFFQYTWVVNTPSTIGTPFLPPTVNETVVYDVIIPDGLWEINTLNEYLQNEMIKNGTYLIYTDPQTYLSSNIYYIELTINPTLYGIQINTFLVPTTLTNGYTVPSNFKGFPSVSQNPVLIIPPQSKLNVLLGFPNGFTTSSNVDNQTQFSTYDKLVNKIAKTVDGTISYLSTTAPNLQPNTTLLLTLTNTQNKYSNPSNMLYALTPTGSIGQQFNNVPPKYNWVKMCDGTINELTLCIIGANDYQPLQIQDPNILIVLVIKQNPILNNPPSSVAPPTPSSSWNSLPPNIPSSVRRQLFP
jgi:hypothetical protein